MTLDKILEEVSGRDFELSDYSTGDDDDKIINARWNRLIAQAKAEILGCVPEEKKKLETDGIGVEVFCDGFNVCRNQILKNLGE